jgi:hypothetical protein
LYIKEEKRYVVIGEASLNWPQGFGKHQMRNLKEKDIVNLRSEGVTFPAIFVAKGIFLSACKMKLNCIKIYVCPLGSSSFIAKHKETLEKNIRRADHTLSFSELLLDTDLSSPSLQVIT